MNNELNNGFQQQNNNYNNTMNNNVKYQNQNSSQQSFNYSNQNNNVNTELNNNYSENNNTTQYETYNQQSNIQNNPSQKTNKNKIIGIVVAVIAVIIVGFLIFNRVNSDKISSGNKSGDTVNVGEMLEIKNTFSDITFSVDSVKRQVKIRDSLLDEEETFIKIGVTITNNEEKESQVLVLNSLNILDKNKKEISDGICYDGLFGAPFYDNITDLLPSEIMGETTERGYIYCIDKNDEATFLEITSFTEFDEKAIEQGQIKSTDSDVFYVNLK